MSELIMIHNLLLGVASSYFLSTNFSSEPHFLHVSSSTTKPS